MADPLSVAGLAAGLVSLGLQVTGGLVSYVGAIRSRPEDLASANGYINSIRAAIDYINSSSAGAQASQIASDSIKFSVDACKDELKALEKLVLRLSTSQHGGTTIRGKIRDGSKKLTYAFHRPDIKELEDRLSKAYTTLQGVMQALGLDLQYSMHEVLVAIKTDTEQTRTNVQNIVSDLLVARSDTAAVATHIHEIKASMPAIANDVARIGPSAIEHMDRWGVRVGEQVLATSRELSRLGVATERSVEYSAERFDQMEKLIQYHVDEERLIRIEQRLEDILLGSAAGDTRARLMDHGAGPVTNMVAARLVSRPSTLRAVIDETEYRENATPDTISTQPGPITQFSTAASWMNHSHERPGVCHCRRRRVRQRTQRRWGPILAFDESETVELHRPGCIYSHSADGGRNRQLGLAYIVGIREVARWAIAYTFSTSSGAGGYSIGPSFTYHPTVDRYTAPAFQIIDTVSWSLFYLKADVQAATAMINLCGSRILQLFQAQRAHPLDVDDQNRSLMHELTDTAGDVIRRCAELSLASNVTDLLGMLLDSGVPGVSHDVFGDSPLLYLLTMTSEGRGRPGMLDLITKLSNMLFSRASERLSVTEKVMPAKQVNCPKPDHWFLTRSSIAAGFPYLLGMLSSCPEITEACECGPLSLAVLARDEQRVINILTATPNAIYEMNFLRLTPLHLAVDKPACLRSLLRESTRTQLSEHWNSYSLLELAIRSCSAKCQSQEVDSDPEISCRSIESVLILLGDERCSLAPHRRQFLDNCCKHAKKEYAKQLKCRRERLKQEALKHLAQKQILDLGLNSSAVLDVDAELVASMLLHKGVISFPEAYGVSGDASYRQSIYHQTRSIETAAIFHNMGFQDVSAPDDDGITPLMLCSQAYFMIVISHLGYLQWLQEHGADMFSRWQRPTSSTKQDCELPVRDTTAAHHFASTLGQGIRWDSLRMDNLTKPSNLAPISPLSLAAVTVDRCHCGCSTHGCSPLTIFLREATQAINEPTLLLKKTQRCLEHACEYIDTNLASAAVRMITFQALGLTHVCCKRKLLFSGELPFHWLVLCCEDGEAKEVREIESEELDLLEVLVEYFENKLAELSTDGPPTVESLTDFFMGYWLERIRHELEKKRKGRTWEEERQETARMGVDWVEEATPPSESMLDLKSPEFWVAEMDRIMAGEQTIICSCGLWSCSHRR